ncbi:hypothetical protein [Cyanothece sp. BG0011]|uniref:hypothetical protein n=1 Tax=Cyanothece sp. BG0011 TaxID=2082950 RepID=UPI0018E4E28B|nr:hypothetical protein [Cyanothece sp. BG0011]
MTNLLAFNIKPSNGATCTAFPVVGGETKDETEVTKTVSQPGLSIPVIGPASVGVNNNWNTDFSIIPLKQYKQYIITFLPKDEGEYKVRGYLKYNDNTADEIYNENKTFTPGEPIEIKGVPKADNIPIQVNLFVGDPISMGKTYTVSVKGCI